ncbi:MAG TPA: hypothetical protein PL029_05365 [Bacteroidia bacterium]|nr:hypothetical protein [Bacteroidia bacterium]
MKIVNGIKFNLKWIVAILVVSVIFIHLNQERYKTLNVIDHDIAHYYSYLPAFFYEKDLSLSFLNDTVHQQTEARYYLPNKTPGGQPVIKMSMGMAVGYLPFFGLAHVYASLSGEAVNGFSAPYHFAVLCSSLFYFVIGLLFLYRVLKMYFTEKSTLMALCVLCFGTNVYFYLTIGAGMSHTFSFMLVAAFIYYTVLWYKFHLVKQAIYIGLLGGLLVLVRPVNILLFVFFFLYDLRSLEDLRVRFKLFLRNSSSLIFIFVCSIIVCLPQLLYWKQVSGHYFFNSYVGEHFYFANPHVFDALFSFRKGWLLYSPLMFFSLIGFLFLRKKLAAFSFVIPLFFALYLYMVFSWWCWWYGGSFGQRVLIDIYPLLLIPMTAFFEFLGDQSKVKRRMVYSIVSLLVLLNLFQTIQAKYNIIHYDSMTRENYFKVFFTTSKQPDREKYLKHPDYEKALRGEDEY